MKKNIIALTLAALFVGNMYGGGDGGFYDGIHFMRGNNDGSPQVELQEKINQEAKQYCEWCFAQFFGEKAKAWELRYNQPAHPLSPFGPGPFPEAYTSN